MISLLKKPVIHWKRFAGSSMCGLMLLLCLNCKAGSIAPSISQGDTLIRTEIDSIAPLLPVRIYLTEHGARLALKAKADAASYLSQWKKTQEALDLKNGDLFKTMLERNIAQDQIKVDVETIKQLKHQLFWANFWKVSFATASAALTTKLIFFKP